MTEQAPTDAEILELWKSYNPLHGIQSFARAVLAKWGSPVVAGPVAYRRPDKHGGFEYEDGITSFEHDPTAERLYTTPQTTQAQAGAVPLTDEQIKDLQDDDVFFGTCRQIVRAIEAAHGIKEGGQHAAN